MGRFAILVTGAAILAVQLIASRIMGAFFGVSLYIWTGILSITLLCLAVGYYMPEDCPLRRHPPEVGAVPPKSGT